MPLKRITLIAALAVVVLLPFEGGRNLLAAGLIGLGIALVLSGVVFGLLGLMSSLENWSGQPPDAAN